MKYLLHKPNEKQNTLKPGNEYEVKSGELIGIPFGNLKRLSLTAVSEYYENLILKTYRTDWGDLCDRDNEPLFNDICLENKSVESVGQKRRSTYVFNFKRTKFSYPSFLQRLLYHLSGRQIDREIEAKVGSLGDTDPKFLVYSECSNFSLRSNFKELPGHDSNCNPYKTAHQLFEWVKKNFKIKHHEARTLAQLVQDYKKYGHFFGDCLEYSRVYTGLTRAYGIPSTLIGGTLVSGPENHTWSEICLPIRSENGHDTFFIPVDVINDKFGNLNSYYFYRTTVPYVRRKGFTDYSREKQSFKLIFE